MKKYKALIFAVIVFIVSSIVFCLSLYRFMISPVSTNVAEKEVVIDKGNIVSIGKKLKKYNLIRNEFFFKVYVKLNKVNNLKAGAYKLSESMSLKEIIDILEEGKTFNKDEIKITFKEGKNMRYIAKTISQNTNNNESDVFDLVSDNNYINSLIDKYWFIGSEIKNQNIYYPLEGYLFPDTYYFNNKDVTVEEIFSSMLDQMDKNLTKLKTDLEGSNLSIHELLTLASIVELECNIKGDRAKIAGVFYNRLNSKWSLGSDVTTYYAFKIDDWSGLNTKQLDDCSTYYNTRCKNYIGLPVGPIGSVSYESIEAVIYPEKHDSYYFVNDCSGKLYLSKNDREHINTINKLKEDGNWCA